MATGLLRPRQLLVGAVALASLVFILHLFSPADINFRPVGTFPAADTNTNTNTDKNAHASPPSQPAGSLFAQSPPLVIYTYRESLVGRANLEFFVSQGLHGHADFVFLTVGETDVEGVIPRRGNVRVLPGAEDCLGVGLWGEVLREGDLWRRYERFIFIDSSLRGPFLPQWSQDCWSDLFLGRLTDETKLVGITANCWPQVYIPSLLWATDSTALEHLLSPRSSPPSTIFGTASSPAGLSACLSDRNAAAHAEISSTALLESAGFRVDALTSAFHAGGRYEDVCSPEATGDVLWDRHYFGGNVHPYETIFVRTDRDVDTAFIDGKLTRWHLARDGRAWDACGGR